jgi:uncharacterized protein YndB with AHSA1/START domain
MSEPITQETIYVTHIAASPQQCWQALTEAEYTTKYFFGRKVESDWKSGSRWMMRKPDGELDVTGEVRESEPPRKLVLSWNVAWAPDLPECVVTYLIEPVGENLVRLTMTETHPTPIPEALLEGGRRGWPMILSGLKSLLETGRPLNIPTPQPPKEMQQ